MPVRRIDEMHKHWLNSDSNLAKIDSKPINGLNNGEDNELDGYKSSLNESVVDDLVSTLTNKLCLKSKSCHTLCKHNRMSPYQTHNTCKSQSNHSCYCLHCRYLVNGNKHRNSKHKSPSISDTYELMQELIKEGSLIKEAVKRLQVRRDDSKKSGFYDYSDEEFGHNENEFNLLNS